MNFKQMETHMKKYKDMAAYLPDAGRKLPYLLCPEKKPEEYSEDERIWLKLSNDKRRAHSPCGWWNYYLDCQEVKIRGGDSLALWTSQSTLGSEDESTVPFLLFLHGGGYSGLTWSTFVDELSRLVVAEYGALDLRGHGESLCKDEENYSLDVLTQDILDSIEWMKKSGKFNLENRPLVLVGHSMGGAVAVDVAVKLQESNDVQLKGLVVLDVVEGSAILALTSMQTFLRNRPREFASVPEAIQWCTRSGQTKNSDSARVSMPGQLKQKYSEKLGTQFVNRTNDGTDEYCDTTPIVATPKRVWAKDGNSSENPKKDLFIWRIDLSKTEKYWRGWFNGLSKKFLSTRCPKLLMLAGVDRLDKELTVGQMQGKFQMQVFHQVGHAVHEDKPDKAAECVASFLVRQRIAAAKGFVPTGLPGC